MTDEEINATHESIVNALTQTFLAEIR
ncbi:MAG: hypothetical protein M3X11_25665 [Acidobacteriota bacterium]|nr:hypothetical protein [Acidobacteriota bacterium]